MLSKQLLVFVFSLKTFSAILFGYLFKEGLINGRDTFLYFKDGNVIYDTLKSNPLIYLKLAIGANDFTPVPKSLLPYTDAMNYWFDNSNYFVVRLNAIIRLFSFGIYNVHAVIFAFLSFIGAYNLYLFFEDKVVSKRMLKFILFGIPSIIFWTSGVHKEAIVIFSLGVILRSVDSILNLRNTKTNMVFAFLGLIILGYTRIYLLAFLLPLIAAIIIYSRFDLKQSSFKMFTACIVVFVLLAFVVDIYVPEFSVINEFLVRRATFLNAHGNMSFPVESFPHNISALMILLWEAITNPFIRPLPNDCNKFLSYLASFETYTLLMLLFALLVASDKRALITNPYAIFSIFFGLSTLFLIGLIVNNSGAIVRYRSVAIPFILIGLCMGKNKNSSQISG